MRVDRGWSFRELSAHMAAAHPGDPRMHVSERTLRRVEEDGIVPTARVQFAIAAQFDLLPSQLWGSRVETGAPR